MLVWLESARRVNCQSYGYNFLGLPHESPAGDWVSEPRSRLNLSSSLDRDDTPDLVSPHLFPDQSATRFGGERTRRELIDPELPKGLFLFPSLVSPIKHLETVPNAPTQLGNSAIIEWFANLKCSPGFATCRTRIPGDDSLRGGEREGKT